MPTETKTCAVTGASGYVGGRIKAFLQQSGWRVTDWTRRATAGEAVVNFRLGQDVDPQRFAGTQALVHCAYDFRPRAWDEILTINVRGSEKLLRAAQQAGVKQIVFLSSLSAFAGCRSLYGRAKLEVESTARALGAIVIRPGLVYGDHAGGVFGGLIKQARQSRIVPLLGRGQQLQFLVHDEDLGRFVERCAAGEIRSDTGPIALAHAEGRTLRQVHVELASAGGRRLTFIPVSWRLAWLGLKTLETLGLPTPFRSDSLIGLIYPNPAPSFDFAAKLDAQCRPFKVTPTMVA